MSDYDYEEGSGLNIPSLIFNILTVVILLVALCMVTVFFTLYINPQSGMNPFPPPTLPPTVAPFTPTPLPGQRLPPTNTSLPPTSTAEPTPTETPAPTEPPTLTPTQFVLVSLTPVPVTEPPDTSGVSFEQKEGSPIAIQNFAHLELGCNWMGVAGHAYDLSGNVITQGITIQLGGSLAGTSVDLLSLTGAAPQYGPGGYEFTLADRPIASSDTLYVQLLDQAGLPLSDRVSFTTYEDCERNLILIDFQQYR